MTWTITEQGITWEISQSVLLSQLGDVVLTSPSNGQSLIYNSATGKWINSTGAGSGDVVGPASATDGAVALYDGTTGKLLKNSTAADVLAALGITSSVTELNYTDGVTSAIQTQIDGKQPLDTDLTAIAALVSAADKTPYATGAGTWSLADFTSLARTLLAIAAPSAVRFYKVNADNTITLRTAAEMLSDIGAQASGSYLTASNIVQTITNGVTTNAPSEDAVFDALALKQTLDATLTALAGVTTAADKIIYATGSDTFTTTDFTSVARQLLDDTTFSAMRTTLGLAIGTDVQAYSSDLDDLIARWTPADTGAAAKLDFAEQSTNGSHKITLKAADAVASDKVITMPDETGTMLTTASGVAKATVPCEFIIACSDETTALTTGTAKATFRAPYAFTVTAVRASVTTAPTGATLLTIDINESGTTILSTKLTFDASEKTTTTAATAAVISDSAIADDAEITIDIDAVGSTIAGAGLKVYIIGTHAV